MFDQIVCLVFYLLFFVMGPGDLFKIRSFLFLCGF